jgi:DNA-binding NtrC family response regulator
MGKKERIDLQELIDQYDNKLINDELSLYRYNNKKMAETLHVDFFSSTFYALRNKYKKEYNLLAVE